MINKPFLIRYAESGKTWKERFDKMFPTVTIGHHHYIRERHLRDCIEWELHGLIREVDKMIKSGDLMQILDEKGE